MRSFDCTTHWDAYRKYFCIHGDTLREAVQASITSILSNNRPYDHPYRLIDYRLEYSAGIIGGSGGVKVIMDCYDTARPDCPVVVEAWIKAAEEDLEV